MHWRLLIVGAVAGTILTTAGDAYALPRFAQKEKKPCAFCHIKKTGGGKRNAVGEWYEHHGFSLKGYTPTRAAVKHGAQKKAAGAPNRKTKGSNK